MPVARKDETINIRIDAHRRQIIARAADVSGKSLTAFMTDAAYQSAQRELLDQRFVGVDAAVFDAVESLLSEPAQANDRLVELFRSTNEWID